MALSISFIRYGLCKSSKEGLKNFRASSKVVMPRCTSNIAIKGLTFSSLCNFCIISEWGIFFKVQRIVSVTSPQNSVFYFLIFIKNNLYLNLRKFFKHFHYTTILFYGQVYDFC